mmetsp:Transcript_44249/g.94298  ORF Transcript_44249/g.94298 Transcript_44249/m.94298 type:complete len:84 (+) Transcript_44249:3-254(+)
MSRGSLACAAIIATAASTEGAPTDESRNGHASAEGGISASEFAGWAVMVFTLWALCWLAIVGFALAVSEWRARRERKQKKKVH